MTILEQNTKVEKTYTLSWCVHDCVYAYVTAKGNFTCFVMYFLKYHSLTPVKGSSF